MYAYTDVYGAPAARMRSQASCNRSRRDTSCRWAAWRTRINPLASSPIGWPRSCSHIYLLAHSHGSTRVSIRLLALIPVAGATHLALSAAVDAVNPPLFLDTPATILATALA